MQFFVITDIVAEQLEQPDTRRPSGNNFSTAIRNQIDGCEILENAYWIRCAGDGRRTGNLDIFRHLGNRFQYNRMCLSREVFQMAFPDTVEAESCQIRQSDDFLDVLPY